MNELMEKRRRAGLKPGWLKRQGLKIDLDVLAWSDSKLRQAGFSREEIRKYLEECFVNGSNSIEAASLLDHLENLRREIEITQERLYGTLSRKS